MTVPVTGGSHSVDEETLHEFHLGFFGFIFTCNFIPVYFSPLPSSYCPLLSAPPSLPPSLLPPLPPAALNPSPVPPPLLPSPPSPGDLEAEPWTSHRLSHTSNAYHTHRGLMFSLRARCCVSIRAQVPLSHSNPQPTPLGVSVLFTQRWGLPWGPATNGCCQWGWRQSHATAQSQGMGSRVTKGCTCPAAWSASAKTHSACSVALTVPSPCSRCGRRSQTWVSYSLSGMFIRLPSIFL